MKRSDAAAKIRKILEGQKQREDFEYQILEVVEEIGMVPPEIESEFYDRSNCQNYMVNEWEPE